jgi:rod shape-determining protein MreD
MLVVLVGVLLVQSTIGLDLRIVGAHPELVWILPVAAGLVGGPEAGALVGFVAGLANDLLLPTPFGLSALVGCLLGFGVGRLVASMSDPGPWVAVVTAVAGSVGAVMLYAVLGAVLGQEQMLRVDLAAVVAVVAVTNAVLALPARRVIGWAIGAAPLRRGRSTAAGARW